MKTLEDASVEQKIKYKKSLSLLKKEALYYLGKREYSQLELEIK